LDRYDCISNVSNSVLCHQPQACPQKIKRLKTAAVTCFFNPQGYASRLVNFDLFYRRLKKQRVDLFTVEAIFPGQQSALAKYENVTVIECETILWQKESLLNYLIRRLPAKYQGIVWADADVYFENSSWFRSVSRALNKFPVVQPFETAVRLPRGARRFVKKSESFESFSSVYGVHPQLLLKGDFARHGHTGFAWAARRDVIEGSGLYDAMIAGSGDHVMAHAFAGDFRSPCIERILGHNEKHIVHFQKWARQIYPSVRGRVGCVKGRLLHLWHGDTENRRYVDRNRELASFGFDPERHLARDPRGLWQWRKSKGDIQLPLGRVFKSRSETNIRDWAVKYFASRKEDG